MPKLKKTKSFSVSEESIEVDFKGTICECANLLKSGIKHQTIVLVAHDDIWNEVNVLNLGSDDSDLKSFDNFVKSMNLSLVDLGITKEEKKTDFSLKHEDFMYLSELFPEYNYIEISKLNDFEIKNVGRHGMAHLKESLIYLSSKNLSVNEYIEQSNNSKQKIIKEMKTEKIQELEVCPSNKTDITVEKIEVIQPEIVSDTPAKKPISLQLFEKLTPDRISELKGLNEAQLQIVKDNPVITITDKETYEIAKKTAAILLKASTNIDGSTGIEATATKYLNTFKNMLKTALQPIAKLTRDPYDKQKQIISAWENAELLKKQAEERAKLLKIKQRTDLLFAVPFSFNGTIYSIGNIYVTPSQIESSSDEEFSIIVENGKNVKIALDAEALKNSEKDKQIAELQAKLAALTGLSEMSNTEPENVEEPVKEPSINQAVNKTNQTEVTINKLSYSIPAIENELLNKLDMENLEHLEKPAYIKCRGYYVRGLIDVANSIEFILNDQEPNTLKKSERIANLCAILKQSV